MTVEDFWWMIELSRIGRATTRELQLRRLRAKLLELSPDELMEFGTVYDLLHDALDRNNVRAAWALICHGSTDSLSDFRKWIISSGVVCYTRVLQNPDALADLGWRNSSDAEAFEFELFGYVPEEVYEALTGRILYEDQALHSSKLEHVATLAEEWVDGVAPKVDPGWQTFDEAAAICPRLAKLNKS